MLPDYYQFSLPTKVKYGIGLASRLGDELADFPGSRALLVTDKVIQSTGLAKKVIEGLKGSKIEIVATYDNVPPNSEIKVVTEAAELGVANKCDMVIAIGGGSVLDSAKVINLLMVKGGPLQKHMGAQLLKDKLLPYVAIPTTSGTGSEATQFAVISDDANSVKLPFAEDFFLPDVAILDPEMTATMPGKVTAATGMDALTHAIECYAGMNPNPVSDALALYAIELIAQNILQAVAVPNDLNARGAMLTASFIAGVAFNHSGVGIVHGISHALGGVYHIPHGLANSIILPFSVEYNMETSAARYARVAQIFGDSGFYPVKELNQFVARFDNFAVNQAVTQLGLVDEWLTKQRAQSLAGKLRAMNQKLNALCGHPLSLREAGVKDNLAKLEQVVRTAMEDGAMLNNPVPATADGVRAIVKEAFSQDLKPIAVSKSELKAARTSGAAKRLRGIFKDEAAIYDILGTYFLKVQADPKLFAPLKNSGLKIRFNYTGPDAAIALDGSTEDKSKQIMTGDAARKFEPEVEFTLQADVAHYFWHGQVNLMQALARKEISPKGNLPRAMRLLPLLEPLYELYPNYLRSRDLAKLAL
ncbi:MAG TPA: iron-containing alcohol dehydrogenase [Turneriella sp.]|nr:iron-containing alcohol dehydrogenase [Turneriella sp.]